MLPTGYLYEKNMYITVMLLIHRDTVNKGISWCAKNCEIKWSAFKNRIGWWYGHHHINLGDKKMLSVLEHWGSEWCRFPEPSQLIEFHANNTYYALISKVESSHKKVWYKEQSQIQQFLLIKHFIFPAIHWPKSHLLPSQIYNKV